MMYKYVKKLCHQIFSRITISTTLATDVSKLGIDFTQPSNLTVDAKKITNLARHVNKFKEWMSQN